MSENFAKQPDSGSFCPACGTPAQIEMKLQGRASLEEIEKWQQHLAISPNCKQAAEQDGQVRHLFDFYQDDPFLTALMTGWKPDLSALKTANPPISVTSLNHRKGVNEVKTDLPPLTDEPKPADITPAKPASKNLTWAMAAVLIIGLVAAIVIVALAVRPTGTENPPAATVTPAAVNNPLDLSYPGSRKLNADITKIYPSTNPNPLPADATFQAYATKDDYKKVITYYRQKLLDNGFKIESESPDCTAGSPDCREFKVVSTIGKNNYTISVSVSSPKEWSKPGSGNGLILDDVIKQLRPDETFIMVLGVTRPSVTQNPSLTITSTSRAVNRTSITPASVNRTIDWSYPGGRKVNFDINAILPGKNSVATDFDVNIQAYATKDNYLKVGAFYRQKLLDAGFEIIDETPDCTAASLPCNEAKLFTTFDRKNADYFLNLNVASPKEWNQPGITTFSEITKNLNPDETSIIIMLVTQSKVPAKPTPVPSPTIK
jgi:hypothetical protein